MTEIRPDFEWLTQQTVAVVQLAAAEDDKGVAEVIRRVGERYAERGLFSLTCSLAACLAHLDGYTVGPADGFYGFGVRDVITGEIVDPQLLAGDGEQGEDMLAGMRFFVAYINSDRDTLNSLFNTCPDKVFAGLCMLVGPSFRYHKEQKEATS